MVFVLKWPLHQFSLSDKLFFVNIMSAVLLLSPLLDCTIIKKYITLIDHGV